MKNYLVIMAAAGLGAIAATAIPFIATAQSTPEQFPWKFTKSGDNELSSSGWLLNRKVGALWYCATQGPLNEKPPTCFPVAMKTFAK